jgi:hypothetical protein
VTAQALLDELDRRGVRVRVVGDRLRLAPPDALDEELLAKVRELKPEIIAALTGPAFTTPAECGWCGGALAPCLVNREGRPALVCTSCRRWTVIGGVA